MRQVPWNEAGRLIGLLLALAATSASANDLVYLDRSDRGFNLPGVSLPQGQDEVHAADGTTCRSAVGGSGTYLDVGAIKDSLGDSSGRDVATYARVVIPLGAKSSRLDCAKLYSLEIERLQMELRLLKAGVTAKDSAEPEPASQAPGGQHWTQDGWTDNGVTGGVKPAAQPTPVKKAAKKKAAKPSGLLDPQSPLALR